MKTTTKLWIGIGVLILLSPLGLILPEHFKAGITFGEWGTDSLKELVGYIPQGLARLSNLWRAPIPDYAFKGYEGKGLGFLSFAYIISAVIGIAATVAGVLVIAKFLSRRGK